MPDPFSMKPVRDCREREAVTSLEEAKEAAALLGILALGEQDVKAGRVRPASGVVARLRGKHTQARAE